MEQAAPRRKMVLREYAETFLVCAIVIIFSRTFVIQQSEIPSASMMDTVLEGDYVLVNRFLHAPVSFEWERKLLPIREIRRGEVLVFKHPPQPEKDYIKRVIGIPGDTVTLVGGQLLVNGRPVDEPYVSPAARDHAAFGPLQLGEREYFMMGDNRSKSSDSRVWGPAPRELIKGRAFMILFSTSGKPADGADPGRVTVRSLFTKIYNLVLHPRLDRFFRLIR